MRGKACVQFFVISVKAIYSCDRRVERVSCVLILDWISSGIVLGQWLDVGLFPQPEPG